VTVNWVRVEGASARFATAEVDLLVGIEGAAEQVSVPLPQGADADGAVSAVVRGLTLSTSEGLAGGEACYDPANGWLPTSIGFALGDPSVSGDTVSFEASAHFTAGNTLESFRECIDAVVDEAVVQVTLQVLVTVGGGAVAEQAIAAAESYPYGDGPADPDPQPLPPETDLTWALEGPMVGWRSASWHFHLDDPDGRGAYLRRLELLATDTQARGAAINYSPVTQQSGFDYTFEGTVVGHEVGGTITRGQVDATFPVELDSAGEPVRHALGLPE